MLGQVFTPTPIVDRMLDMIGYNNVGILHRSIIDPSCGDGQFLVEVVNRYITQARLNRLDDGTIKRGLQYCISGVEIDPPLVQRCVQRLTDTASAHGIDFTSWDVVCDDAILRAWDRKYDFVVGNPPYIKVHDIPHKTRQYIKRHVAFCSKGTIDTYLAFFGIGLRVVKDNGKLIYITPNSVMRNKSARGFREYITIHNLLQEIVDFGSEKVFVDVDTYTCIILLSALAVGVPEKRYTLIGGELLLVGSQNIQILSSMASQPKLGELCNIQYGLSTQRDVVYITDKAVVSGAQCSFNGYIIEAALVRDIIKAGRMNDRKTRKVIFPYRLRGGRWEIIPEEELRDTFPLTYNYLLVHKQSLLDRDMDANILWYAFGRSQAIQAIHQDKVIVSVTVKDTVGVQAVGAGTLMYSGIFITLKDRGVNLQHVLDHLRKEEFLRYIRIVGKDLRSDYKVITTTAIKRYGYIDAIL